MQEAHIERNIGGFYEEFTLDRLTSAGLHNHLEQVCLACVDSVRPADVLDRFYVLAAGLPCCCCCCCCCELSGTPQLLLHLPQSAQRKIAH